MKLLLPLTSLIEAATGLALLITPAIVARLRLGADITGISVVLACVAGIAILNVGIACWPPRDATQPSIPALRAMLVYNALVAAYLLYLSVQGDWVGMLLWIAVALHGVFAVLLAQQLLTPSIRAAQQPHPQS